MDGIPPPPPGFNLDPQPVYGAAPKPSAQYEAPQAQANLQRTQQEVNYDTQTAADRAAEQHAKAISAQLSAQTQSEQYKQAHVAEDPSLLGLTGPQLLAKLPPDEAPMVKAMVEGRMAPPTASALKDPQWQQRLKWANQVDPDFNEARWQMRVKTMTDAATGRLAQANNAINTAIGHAGMLMDQAQQPGVAGHGDWPLIPDVIPTGINAVENALNKGNPALSVYNDTAQKLGTEEARAYQGGAPNEGDTNRYVASLSANLPLDAKRAVIHNALELFASKTVANLSQYDFGTTGGKPPLNVLDAQALHALQKYAPDVLQKYFYHGFITAPGSNGASPPPDGGGAPGGSGPTPGVTPPSGGVDTRPDQQGSALIDQMVQQGIPYQSAMAQWKQFNDGRGTPVAPIPPDAYNAAVQYAKQHPGANYHPGSATISHPISPVTQAISQAAESAPGVAIASGVNAAAGGIPLAAAGDQGAYFQQAAQANHPDAQLAGTIIGGTAGALAGEAGLGAAGMAPGFGRSLLADTGYGAVSGATSSPQNALSGAVMGGVAGAAGSVAGQALVRGGAAALRGVSSPNVNALADVGVPLTVGQTVAQSGRAGQMVKGVEDRLTGFSGVGDMIQGRRMEGLKAFNSKAFDQALSPIGASVNGAVGEEAVQKASQAVSDAFSSALKGKVAVPDQEFISAARGPLERLARNQRVGPEIVDAIEGTTEGLFDAKTGALSGEHMQAFLNGLRQIREGYKNDPLYQTLIKPSVQGVETAVEGMFRRQAPEVMPDFNRAKAAYRRLSTISDAVNSGVNTNGMFTPAQLGQVARGNAKRFNGPIAAASGSRPFADIQRAAQNVLPSKVPDSGTAGRVALAAGSLPAVGAGIGYLGGDTKSGAETGLGLTALLAALYSRGGQAGLSKLLLSRSPKARAIAQQMLDRAPIAGAAGTALTQTGGPR